MQYYLAPMEGITTYIYRNAHARYFGGIDKYFTPFISDKGFISDKNFVTNKDFISDKNFITDANSVTAKKSGKSLNTKELRDILPENNTGITLVPQVLTNSAGRFLAVAKELSSYGYDTVNLNLGCPSGTVTAKKRGAGFLGVPDELDAFLYEIYEKCPMKISIKTRLGVSDLPEWNRLLDVYAKYPIHELIIHTRLLKEFYTGTTHPEAYAEAVNRLPIGDTVKITEEYASDIHELCKEPYDSRDHLPRIPLCYNGDIVSLKSLEDAMTAVNASLSLLQNTESPVTADRVMIGRGIIRNPALAVQLREARSDTACISDTRVVSLADSIVNRTAVSKEDWRAFHDEILDGYIKIMSGDSPVLFKMKDLWTYMSQSFSNSEKYLKKIRKANRITDYVSAVDGLFREQEILACV